MEAAGFSQVPQLASSLILDLNTPFSVETRLARSGSPTDQSFSVIHDQNSGEGDRKGGIHTAFIEGLLGCTSGVF